MEIIAFIHPFVMEQEFCIFKDNLCIKSFTCNLENMTKKIYEICEKENINQVHFHGGQLYALQFRDEFISHKFGNKNINIIID